MCQSLRLQPNHSNFTQTSRLPEKVSSMHTKLAERGNVRNVQTCITRLIEKQTSSHHACPVTGPWRRKLGSGWLLTCRYMPFLSRWFMTCHDYSTRILQVSLPGKGGEAPLWKAEALAISVCCSTLDALQGPGLAGHCLASSTECWRS